MSTFPSLSIVIATHARHEPLVRTLASLVAADREGLDVEIVVVENGEKCGAASVVRSRSRDLVLRYLHRAEANKSRALNLALDEGGLGDLVVFLDDDVEVDRGWLRAVAASAHRWPARKLFGGRIRIRWPEDAEVPGWAKDDLWIRRFAFAEHDLGASPREYGDGLLPYGPNWWARREVFDGPRRFDPTFGPRAGRWVSGEETSFLWRLQDEGVRALYVPDALVHHHADPSRLTPAWLRKRAWREGLGRGTLEPPPRAAFFERHRRLWQIEQVGRAARAAAAYGLTRLRPSGDEATIACARAARRLGAEVARLRLRRADTVREGNDA